MIERPYKLYLARALGESECQVDEFETLEEARTAMSHVLYGYKCLRQAHYAIKDAIQVKYAVQVQIRLAGEILERGGSI